MASPVGMNREVVSHGDNGLLADTPDDWARALEALLCDEALARRLGAAGRRSVEADYGYSAIADRWAAFLRSIAGSRTQPIPPCSVRRALYLTHRQIDWTGPHSGGPP